VSVGQAKMCYGYRTVRCAMDTGVHKNVEILMHSVGFGREIRPYQFKG
jgi:hypothetical protein